MSDKFFFKGRQDSRQSHIQYNYQPKTGQKTGSRKYPLSLQVTSEARKLEVAAQVAEAGLYADITVDSSPGALELLGELTALQNKGNTVKRSPAPAPNAPCSCGSGKKYKKCCALPEKSTL